MIKFIARDSNADYSEDIDLWEVNQPAFNEITRITVDADLFSSQTEFRKIHRVKCPEHLFHYTNPYGLNGIIESGSIWASGYQYLNDARELRHYLEISRSEIQNLMHHSRPENERAKLGFLRDHATSMTGQIFVASFSEHKDQLSQWRGYTSEAGYSFGLPRKRLIDAVKGEKFLAAKCIYGDDEARRVAREVAEYFLNCFKTDDLADESSLEVRSRFGLMSNLIAAFFKHRAFEEEAEWRLVKFLKGKLPEGVDYRPSTAGFVPYVNFTFLKYLNGAEEDEIYEIPMLVDGPGNRETGQFEATRLFRLRHGLQVSRAKSEIPYRTS